MRNPKHRRSDTIEDRFWGYVPAPEPGACWIWQGPMTPDGYGCMKYQREKKMATHFALLICKGISVPAGMYACHKCDNPPCVNPDHLFVGTAKDNNRDCAAKGRKARLVGERSPAARLTAEQVIIIRGLAPYYTHRQIAEMFGLPHHATVGSIIRRKTWAHL